MPKRSAFDAERLQQLLRAQHHAITRQQALLCGLPPSTLDRYIAPGGRWQRLLPGAATQNQREMAALRYAGPADVDSYAYHLSAADRDRTNKRHARMFAHGILPLHFSPKRVKTDPDGVLNDLRHAIEQGSRRPPPPITALPAAD